MKGACILLLSFFSLAFAFTLHHYQWDKNPEHGSEIPYIILFVVVLVVIGIANM